MIGDLKKIILQKPGIQVPGFCNTNNTIRPCRTQQCMQMVFPPLSSAQVVIAVGRGHLLETMLQPLNPHLHT
jgi:hypothetical protein